MVILASDTSTSRGSVALRSRADGGVVMVTMEKDHPHSETLLPAVDEVLVLAQRGLGDVTALAVGVGPGAFTGLRVGLATFKGFAASLGVPMVAVPSLDAVAYPALRQGKEVVVMADARKGEVYAAFYQSLDKEGLPLRKAGPVLVPAREAAGWASSVGGSSGVVLGNAASASRRGREGQPMDFPGSIGEFPQASEILVMGEIMVSLGRAVDPGSLVPEYVRRPDAQPQRWPRRSPEP